MPRLYRVFDSLENKETWHRTLSGAHDKVNEQEPVFRPTQTVELREGAGDLDAIIECANKGFAASTTVLRRWRGTKRGGLREIIEGQEDEPEESEKPAPGPRAGTPEAAAAAAAFFANPPGARK